MKYLSIFLTLIFLASCSFSSAAKDKQTEPTSHIQTDYIIQPGDTLGISVWKEKDLQRDVVVRPDGKLNFPLIGEIEAAGLTFKAFQKNFITKLSRYVPHPEVTVAIRQATGNKIFVTGKVNRPGEYPNNRNLDVMQALSLAGGLNTFASERKIKILRRDKNGKLQALTFNYKKVKKGKNLEQNIILKGGDVIVVH